MLHSPMVFPTTNEYFHVPPMMDESVAKLMNTDPIENYMSSTASPSPIQDYLMAPISANTMNGSFHPQQQHQNQRQHQIQFPIVPQTMPSMVPHSAPSSPQYPVIKAEEVSQQLQHHQQQQQQNMEFNLLYPSFELGAQAATSPQAHVLPSQRSPQMQQQQRVMSYPDATLLQQQRQHQHQQQQHAQQLRLQHQQQQQFQQQQQQQHQMMFDSTPSQSNVSSAVSMSIPITSSIMSSIVSSGSSVSNLFTPTNLTTSSPFFHASTFEQGEYASQRPNSSYTPAAHPAAPRRKREESGQQQMHNNNNRQHSPALLEEESSPVLASGLVTVAQNKATTLAASPTSRASTSARLDKVKTTRSTKITKSSSLLSTSSFTATCSPSAIDMIPSSTTPSTSNVEISATEITPATATASRSTPKRTGKKPTSTAAAASHDESRESSQQPSDPSEAGLTHLPNSTGNITHPRRAAQNRAAQRTFRNRRKAYIKELEQKVQDMDRTQELMKSIHNENQEVWRRLQILESLATRSGLTVPSFPALTPVASSHLMTQHTTASSSAEGHAHNASHDYQGMNNNSTHSNEEDEEDEDMSDYSSHPHQQTRHF